MNILRKALGAVTLSSAFLVFLLGFVLTCTLVGAVIGIPLMFAGAGFGVMGLRLVGSPEMAARLSGRVALPARGVRD